MQVNAHWRGALTIILALVGASPAFAAPLAHDPDINDDGWVNVIDLGLLRNCFFANPKDAAAPCATSDLNGDGAVNAADLGAMKAHFFTALPTPQEARSLYFAPRPKVGTGPGALAVGDIDSDGVEDILSGSVDDGEVTLLLGNGDGTYRQGGKLATPDPRAIALARVNADAHEDLLVLDRTASVLRVYLGDGAGQFAAGPGPYPAGVEPSVLAVADLNDDGHPDAIAGSAGSDKLSILSGTAAGGFATQTQVIVGNDQRNLEVADFNGDERLDILVHYVPTPAASKLVVAFGLGAGALDVGEPFVIGNFPVSGMATGDIDGDGIVDFAVGLDNCCPLFPNLSAVAMALGNGDGTFASSTAVNGIVPPKSLELTDVDGDGHVDLLVATSNGRVMQYAGSGGGFAKVRDYSVGRGVRESRIADLNGDGLPDVVTSDAAADGVSILLNDAQGRYLGPIAVSFGTIGLQYKSSSIIASDIDNDGTMDLVSPASYFPNIHLGSNRLLFAAGDGDGGFSLADTVDFFDPVVSVAVARFNGDQWVDAIPAVPGSTSFCIGFVVGSGNGLFAMSGSAACDMNDPFPWVGVNEVQAVDLNADARPDIIAQSSSRLVTGIGNGDGTLGETHVFARQEPIAAMTSGRFNDDDNLDIATAFDENGGTVEVFLGDGTGDMPASSVWPTGLSPTHGLVAADLDADGDDDLIAIGQARRVAVLLNDAAGGFAEPFFYTPGAETAPAIHALAAGDVNRDGIADLVSTNRHGNNVTLSLGNGDGGYQPGVDFAVGSEPTYVILVDVNGDDRLDIATANDASWDISVLLQR